MSHPNFVIDLDSKISEEEAAFILSPAEFEHILFVREPWEANLESLAVLAGHFASKADARAAGIEGSIPHGVELIGNLSKTFWVWAPIAPAKPPTISKKKIWTGRWFELASLSGALIGPNGVAMPPSKALGNPPSFRRINL